jgi:dipeptidyl aminopeptidase/acylaminoacyl peptidase
MLDLAQLLRVPQVHPQFDISPGDSSIAFAWNKTGEWQIYEVSLSPFGRLRSAPQGEVRGEGEITQLTFGIGGKFNPRYSPDGTCLAYVLDVDGSESYHLIVFDRASNTHRDLTPDSSYALQPNFCWSPDGNQLAFLSNQNGHFSTYIISATGCGTKLILDTSYPSWQVEWSPTGKHLAVCCEMHGQDYGTFIVDVETKQVTELNLNAQDLAWSPDGTKLAFHSDLHGWFDIGIYDLSSKEITWKTDSEGDSQSPALIPKRNPSSLLQIAYTQSKGAVNWIELLTADDSPKKYHVGKGIHAGIKFTSDGKQMFCTFNGPIQPPDLWMIHMEQGTSGQLTNSMPKNLLNEEFVLPEEIYYEGMDGTQIPALLFRPKQTPAPAVVIVHGGPNWHYSAEWNPTMAHLASRGFVVLAPNYRGSTGYGREWQYAACFDLGGVDTRDVAAGAHYLVCNGLAYKDRIAVTGRSHGGYLTTTCLTQFPELWCGGSAVVPFMNWFKSHEESREDLQHWNIENMGDPKENYELWYNASPYFFLDQVTAPVQLICGGNDPRCPASDSIQAHDRLIELGKEVELLLYEDEGHAFLKIENIIDSELRRVEFLAKVLDNKNNSVVE